MNDKRTWPSRGVQIGVLIILGIIAAISVTTSTLSKSKAEKLYERAWLSASYTSTDNTNQQAIADLREAIKLSPGNSLYEQALVWKTPLSGLPALMSGKQLEPKARRLAAGLAYSGYAGSRNVHGAGSVSVAEKLKRIRILRQMDSKNPFPYYMEAAVLFEAGRQEEASADVRMGNRLGAGHLYIPEVTDTIRYSLAAPDMGDVAVIEGSACRRASVGMLQVADKLVLNHKTQDACEVLEESCRMGTNLAIATPHLTTNYILGRNIFRTSFIRLLGIPGGVGATRLSVKPFRRIEEAFRGGMRSIEALQMAHDQQQEIFKTVLARYSIPAGFAIGAAASILLALIVGAWSLAMGAIAKAKEQKAITIPTWGEGWLIRLCLRVYIPILILLGIFVGYVVRQTGPITEDFDTILFGYSVPFGLIVLAQIIIIMGILREVRKSLKAASGEPVGTAGILFVGPANRLAWSSRKILGAMGVHIGFLAALLFACIIIYKPVFGNEPWEWNRTQFNFTKDQASVLDHQANNLIMAIPKGWGSSK